MASNIQTSSVSVNSTTVPVEIVAARAGRVGLKIYVKGTVGAFLMIGKDNTITPSDSYPLPLGEYPFEPVTEGAVWALGTGMEVRILEIY